MRLERPFSVGDKVYFKTWDEMAEEYGLSSAGSIMVPCSFTSTMEENIDKDQEYTIITIVVREGDDDSATVKLSPGVSWRISLGMLKHADEHEKLPAVPDKVKQYIDKYYNSPLFSFLQLWEFTKGKRRFEISGIIKDKADIIFVRKDNEDLSKITIVSQHEITSKITGLITNTGTIIFAESVGTELKDYIKEKSAILDFLQKEVDPDNEFWPWIKGEAELTDEQVERLNKQADKLEAEIQEEKFNAFLDGFGEMIKANSGENEKASLEGFITDRKNALETLRHLNKKIYDLRKEIFYLEHGIKSVDLTEFMAVLKGNRENILFFKIEKGYNRVLLVVKQPLLFFEDEEWEICKSNLLEECRTDYGEKTAAIMDAIFTRKAQLTFEQDFYFTCRKPGDNDIGRYTSERKDKYKHGIPNPHMKQYDCWGDNKAKIINFLDEGKYDLAYTQIISAIAGINITDSAVISKFMEYLGILDYRNSYCITDMETGKVMTLKEAKDYYGGKVNEKD